MGQLIYNLDVKNISELRIPGTTVPSIYWATPLGKWSEAELITLWKAFFNPEFEALYSPGLLLHSMDFDDREISKRINMGDMEQKIGGTTLSYDKIPPLKQKVVFEPYP